MAERLIEAEGAVDHHLPLGCQELIRVAHREERERPAGVDLEEGQVGLGVDAHHPVRQADVARPHHHLDPARPSATWALVAIQPGRWTTNPESTPFLDPWRSRSERSEGAPPMRGRAGW